MKWIGQHIWDLAAKFRNTVDFSEDVTFYQPVNNANPGISIGASDDERLRILVDYQGTTTQLAQIVAFHTFTESGTAQDGRFHFAVDEVNILKIQDGGIDFFAGKGIGINGVDILTDNGSGTATLSNIDALDATTIATFETAMEANLDTFGSQMTSATSLASIGTITTGEWNATDIGVAHGGTGASTLDANSVLVGNGTGSLVPTTPMKYSNDAGESNTSTLSIFSNQDVGDKFTIATTTHGATTLTTIDDDATAAHFEIAADGDITLDSAGQIKLEPAAGNNILLDGTIAIDAGVVTGATSITSTSFVGALTGQADTVATIAGLAPNTATTQASQPNITGVGTIGTGVWEGATIKTAYIGDAQVTVAKLHADAVQTSGESFADNDTSLMTSAAIDDAIIKGGSATVIKVLPYNFMSNEDGGANKSVQFRDDTIIGVRATADNSELYAFVEIPIGKTATAVIVYGNDSGNVVEVFESDINAGALTDKTHASGCVVGTACDITDVAADTTNYLVIKVTITSYTNDIVYGAAVTISG